MNKNYALKTLLFVTLMMSTFCLLSGTGSIAVISQSAIIDPKITDALNQAITRNDPNTIETIYSHATEKVGDYALLILLEFYHDLNPRALETMEEYSPHRWEQLQHYLDVLLTWASLSKKADNHLGGLFTTRLKEKLGEHE